MTGGNGDLPTRFDLNSDLDLKLAYAIPTFEAEIGWQGIARTIWADYWEASSIGSFALLDPGETKLPRPSENIQIPAFEVGTVDYGFRTAIAAHERPVGDSRSSTSITLKNCPSPRSATSTTRRA